MCWLKEEKQGNAIAEGSERMDSHKIFYSETEPKKKINHLVYRSVIENK